jgi:hypothetical protein
MAELPDLGFKVDEEEAERMAEWEPDWGEDRTPLDVQEQREIRKLAHNQRNKAELAMRRRHYQTVARRQRRGVYDRVSTNLDRTQFYKYSNW